MRRALIRLSLGVAVLVAATPAAAQLSKPRRDPFVHLPPVRAAAAPRTTPAPAPVLPKLGFTGVAGLTGLPSAADPAPACRTRCTQARLVCEAGEDDACPSAWAMCIARCGR